MKNWLDKYTLKAQNGIEGTMGGLTDKGFNYNGAWGGPSMQNGGYVDSVLNANRKLDWVQRLYEKGTPSIQIPGQEGRSTHFMEYADNRVYPTVVRKNGKLKYLKDKAYDYADKTKTFIEFPTEDAAKWFSENYKTGTDVLKEFQMGGSLPGSVGFTYARTNDPAPANGKYTKKTKASAQNGKEMKFWQEGLDWKPKTISQWGGDYALDVDQSIKALETLGSVSEAPQKGIVKSLTGKYQLPSEALGMKEGTASSIIDLFLDPLGVGMLKGGVKSIAKGASKVLPKLKTLKPVAKTALSKYQEGGIIEDPMGQWAYPGEITRIPSNEITMQGVDYPVLGISDTGDTQMMYPEQEYQFDGESVTEYPMMQDGGLMSYREPVMKAKDRFINTQLNKYGDPNFVNKTLEAAEKQGYDYGAANKGPLDAIRHAAMSASIAKKLKVPKIIEEYTPALDDAIRMGVSNLMGFGYELANFNPEGFWMDLKNNYTGSNVGVMKNLSDKERTDKIVAMLKDNKLSVDNPNRDKKKKENGGWLSKYN